MVGSALLHLLSWRRAFVFFRQSETAGLLAMTDPIPP